MKLEFAQKLADASDGELDLYEDYSGRGMFGKTTAGITGSKKSIMRTAIIVGFEMGSNGEEHQFEEFLETIDNLRFDNLGMDMIAY
jgi:hypothetical protein